MRLKIYLAILVLLLSLPDTSTSEIRVKVDKFENSTIVESSFENISPWRLLSFQKINGNISLLLSRLEPECWLFSYVAQFNIDGRIYNAPIESFYGSMIPPNLFLVTGVVDIDNLSNELSMGKEVVIKVYFTNKPSLKWKVPKNVLTEWKTLIKVIKDGG